MTSTVTTKNIFDNLSEKPSCWSKLGQVSSKSEQKQNNLFKIGESKRGVKYVVHNNYVPEQERVLNNAFANMSNKDEVAKKLRCTKACNFSLKNSVTGEYGTCYRSTCTFAHSLEELNDPMCEFDEMCRYKQGRYNKDGTFDVTLKCTFRHSSETREEWLERTGKKLPDLPETLTKNISNPITPKVLGSGYEKKTSPFTPPIRINLQSPSTPVKAPKEKICREEPSIEKVKKNLSKVLKSSPKKSPEKEIYIIKVPSEELAKLAIKTVLEHGVFNIQVIIE